MKRLICVSLVLILSLAVLPGFSHAQAAETVLKNEKTRKIEPKGLGEDGKFPINPVIEGESPVTGLSWTGKYMPMLVQIDNDLGGIGARAPWGASLADIIYETPLHAGGYTRLSFLFSDVIPESVGPVRSARMTHAELREEWDAGFLYYGGQEVDGTDINDVFYKTKANRKGVLFRGTAGTGKEWKKYYTRVSGLESPHNVDANVLAMQGLIPESHVAPSRPFLFTDDLPTGGEPAVKIQLGQKNKDYSSSFVYDAENNVYLRYVHDQPYIDKSTQEQLAFSNVIIQRTKLTYYNDDSARPITVNVGSGNADIFIGGRYIAGFWKRTALDQRTVFFDQDGNELALQRGKTFISILDNRLAVSYTGE